MRAYGAAIAKLVTRADLSAEEAEAVMAEIMDGDLEPAPIAALLTALAVKGECAQELVGFARAMRRRAVRVRAPEGAIDTCGTGGSGQDKPNTSTLSAFVLAAAGVPVAKHGNRSNRGRCGSADVLERLGVPIDLLPEEAERLLFDVGITFLFAPRYHPAMRHAAPVRRTLPFRTAFNLLGPLANPAAVRAQVLGVSDRARAPLLAEALVELGAERAMIVSAHDGLDEISVAAPTEIWSIRSGELERHTVEPESFGLTSHPVELRSAGAVEDNARLFTEVLEGHAREAVLDLVALNASAGFVIAGRAADLRGGLALAREVLRSGAAARKLDDLRDAARALVDARLGAAS